MTMTADWIGQSKINFSNFHVCCRSFVHQIRVLDAPWHERCALIAAMTPRFLTRLGMGKKRRDSRVYPLRNPGHDCQGERPTSLTSTPILLSSTYPHDKATAEPPTNLLVLADPPNQSQSRSLAAIHEPQPGRKRKFMDSLNNAVKRVMTGIGRKFSSASPTADGSRSSAELSVLHSPLCEKGGMEASGQPANLLDEIEWREIRVVERFEKEVRSRRQQSLGIDAEELELPEELLLELTALLTLYRERALPRMATSEKMPTRGDPETGLDAQSVQEEPCQQATCQEEPKDETELETGSCEEDSKYDGEPPCSTEKNQLEATTLSTSPTDPLGGEDGQMIVPSKTGELVNGPLCEPALEASIRPDEQAAEPPNEKPTPAEQLAASDSFASCISYRSSLPNLASLFEPPHRQDSSLEYLELLADLYKEETDSQSSSVTPIHSRSEPVSDTGSLGDAGAGWSSTSSLADSHSGAGSDSDRRPRRKSSKIMHLIALFEGSIMDLASEEEDNRKG